jgi:hypothetical protein
LQANKPKGNGAAFMPPLIATLKTAPQLNACLKNLHRVQN